MMTCSQADPFAGGFVISPDKVPATVDRQAAINALNLALVWSFDRSAMTPGMTAPDRRVKRRVVWLTGPERANRLATRR